MLPSATEIACALGLGEALVGVSHECDFPPEARGKPVVVHSLIDPARMSPAEIDRAVSEALRKGGSLYRVDEELFRSLAPDLVLTQDLCDVCAPATKEVEGVVRLQPKAPQVLYLTPRRLKDVFRNVVEVGEATGREARARELVAALRRRVDRVARATRELPRPRVFCMEWLDPPYNAGHWMPEMTALAGGDDRLAIAGAPSVRTPWEKVVESAPEVFLFTPCGFSMDRVLEQARGLRDLPGWDRIPAARGGRVWAVDADAYCARPGPRLVDGIELMAHLFHPEAFDGRAFEGRFQRIDIA